MRRHTKACDKHEWSQHSKGLAKTRNSTATFFSRLLFLVPHNESRNMPQQWYLAYRSKSEFAVIQIASRHVIVRLIKVSMRICKTIRPQACCNHHEESNDRVWNKILHQVAMSRKKRVSVCCSLWLWRIFVVCTIYGCEKRTIHGIKRTTNHQSKPWLVNASRKPRYPIKRKDSAAIVVDMIPM